MANGLREVVRNGRWSPATSREIGMKPFKLLTLSALAACVVASPPMLAAGAPHAAAHNHDRRYAGPARAGPQPQWSTDETLHVDVARIRALVDAQLGAAHAG